MAGADILWQQRFGNDRRALARLSDAVELSQQRRLSDLERQGMIQAFAFPHELSWNSLKDFLVSRGVSDLFGSRDTTREAFAQGLISDGEGWMEMIHHRNLSTHTDGEATVQEIVTAVFTRHLGVSAMTLPTAATSHGLPAAASAKIQAALDDLLLPWHFELSLQASLQSPELIDHIQRAGVAFYRRPCH